MNKDNENLDTNENDSSNVNNKSDDSYEENLKNENADSSQPNINIDIDKIIKDMQYYEKLKSTIIEMQQSNNNTTSNLNNVTSSTNNPCDCNDLQTIMNNTNDVLILIDSLKTEICRLPLNPCQREYFNLYILPLLSTLDMLSRSSYNLGTSSALISDSKSLCVNKLELQKNLNLIYCINRKCSELYCALEKSIDVFICKTPPPL